MKALIGLIVAIIVIGGGWYFFSSSGNQEAATEQHDTGTAIEQGGEAAGGDAVMEEGGTATDGNVSVFTVEGGAFFFSPSTMTVKKGDTVRVVFKNVGGFHDFVIDELNVATKQIQTGQEDAVEFVADRAGTFEYYCSVGNHRQQGMVGTLTVTE